MPTPISAIAESLHIDASLLRTYGQEIAKVSPDLLASERKRSRPGKLVLVSAITPTPAGEGKTTTSIGLAQGLARIGESVCVALREPSLGPAFGRKGGATGGGQSTLHPQDRINLHFTGDFHAISAAHNLLAAMVDNHLHFGQSPRIDPRKVLWPRVIDMNDRALRNVVTGLGGTGQGMPRESHFEITAASEVMAALCLSESMDDLTERLGAIVVAIDEEGNPVRARDLQAAGAMVALLQDAIWPNLVQTAEGVPGFVHGGPFANIAHGCNSVLATRMAMHVADWTITEAGFGFDLGAEKFFDIKCRSAGLEPAAVVLVATVRALKYHGGQKLKELETPNVEAVQKGLPNLARHVESAQAFGYTPVIELNQFGADSDEEIAAVAAFCDAHSLPFAASDHFARGGEGAETLAKVVVEKTGEAKAPKLTYELSDDAETKVRKVAQTIYGADDVTFTTEAKRQLKKLREQGFGDLPVCMAKTQSSLSDNPKKRGRPEGFVVTVREVQLNAAAGFLVVLTGQLLRMPGLPRDPRARHIEVRDGKVHGVM